MKRKLLAALLVCLLILSACRYIVVEDGEESQVRTNAALAETETAPPAAEAPVPADEPFLARGSRDGEEDHAVAGLQARLIALNYLSGAADGIFGGGTEAALRSFQAMNGLEETGALDEATERALASAWAIPMPTPEPTPLARGAEGDGVKEIQTRLKLYGFLSGSADGAFGSVTEQALKAFQQYAYDMGELEPTPMPTPEPTPTPAPVESPEPEEKAGEAEGSEAVPEYVFEPSGVVDDEVYSLLTDGSFRLCREAVGRGSKGWEVLRVQRRLADLDYLWDAVDGRFGPNTQESLAYFQKLNQLEQTGVADEATQARLFSAEAVKSDKPKCLYLLKVSVADQRVYAYRWKNGSYSTLAKTMTCSTGTKSHPTPLGTYRADGPAGRWYYFNKYKCWAQYAYRIDGAYLFHSVIYSDKSDKAVRWGSVNALGGRASHGCVRLSVADARWIYENCPAGTTVKIY